MVETDALSAVPACSNPCRQQGGGCSGGGRWRRGRCRRRVRSQGVNVESAASQENAIRFFSQGAIILHSQKQGVGEDSSHGSRQLVEEEVGEEESPVIRPEQ